ncbi:hypothetical protein P170DRAFT_26906 [Aspergillus steynii IBT 23096]|uniref:Uncharacterized protein n=1 Tax=Aspergillus steynii IBT 23096 TaxID=1392250 RepID=A0A2I2GPX9_9EURO|nr:uncharacterized protein P170DRAFT_26906 [Aspergillus steynii IBT 23096]PLB54929.1 hypothetical protein P170DRAFT_26906 [Aspergillus steynii IBT 23096]
MTSPRPPPGCPCDARGLRAPRPSHAPKPTYRPARTNRSSPFGASLQGEPNRREGGGADCFSLLRRVTSPGHYLLSLCRLASSRAIRRKHDR